MKIYFTLIILINIFIFKNKIINNKINGVYFIRSISSNSFLNFKNTKIKLSKYKSYFRIIKIENDTYFIETIFKKYRLGINELDDIILKINFQNENKFKWNIIKVAEEEYIVQNKYNDKLLKENNHFLQLTKNSYKNLNYINKISIFKRFNFIKLYEEFVLSRNYIKIINKENIDVIIKYIDLTDKLLNRTGIKQFYKDKDNEELKFSLRSILEYIPWVRKIFILMPNQKVNFLKSVDEIIDKIIYIKDKDFLGFDSANIQSFLFNLYKMEKFGLSKNFIYMEDDYFIGRRLTKLDFFYYETIENKVVPYIISSSFFKMNKTKVIEKFYEFLKLKDYTQPHSKEGFWNQIINTEKFMIDNYNISFVDVSFTHNSIPLNIDDIEVISNISNKYKYINETLYNKQRNVLSLCYQHISNLFNLNIIHRKVHLIYNDYISIEYIKNKKLNKPLFVLNTGGNHRPTKREYKLQKRIMMKRFPSRHIYDIKTEKNKLDKFLEIIFIFILKI